MLEKAMQIATKAHEGQLDKGGQPYILHLLRVMISCKTDTDKVCAVLHDVVEDTGVTLDDLRKEGFSEEVLEVIDLLTKKPDENYESFIERICDNEVACRVKIADLHDNMDLSRIENPTFEDKKRVDKYLDAIKKIKRSGSE